MTVYKIKQIINKKLRSMKKFLSLCMAMFISISIFAQTVTIGTGTTTNKRPFGMYWDYERCATLYTASEIGVTGNITSLGWYIQSLSSASNGPVKIYLKTTTDNVLNADTWANFISGATLVYDNASTTFTAGGWQTFSLSPAFNYTADNLLVLVETNFGTVGTNEANTAKAIRYTATTDYMMEAWWNDDTPPVGNGTTATSRPNIQISFPSVPSDAGVSAINTPSSPVNIGSNNIGVTIKNFGTSILTSATIAWKVNSVLQAPYSWSGSLASNATDGPVTIGNYNFATNGFYTITAWTENPNGSTDSDHSNDTTSKVVFVQGYAALPFIENFDSAWVNKFDTKDVPSLYWTNTPATSTPSTESNSWRRDDELATIGWNGSFGSYTPAGEGGTIHSARFHSYDASPGENGALDAFLDFSATGEKQLKFWYINPSGSDSLAVYISTDNGSNYTFLQKFTTASTWQLEQISLGASTSATTIISFKATSDWGVDDIGLDGVQVAILSPNDVGVSALLKPISKVCGIESDSVEVVVSNYGASPQTNIPVTVNIVTPSGSSALNATLAGPLAVGSADTLFMGLINTVTIGNYTFKAYTHLATDNVLTNDTTNATISITAISTIPYVEDFQGVSSLANWNTNMSRTSGHGNTSYVIYKYMATPSTAYAYLKKKVGPITNNSYLSFDYRYTKYSDGTAYTLRKDTLKALISIDCGNSFSSVYVIDSSNHVLSATMKHISIPISQYAGSSVILGFRASNGALSSYYIDIDNVMITEGITTMDNEYSNNPDIRIFPNPTNGMINIVTDGINNADLTIYTIQGQIVYTEKLNAATSNKQLNLSYLTKGIYMIRISDEKSNIIKKLIIQ